VFVELIVTCVPEKVTLESLAAILSKILLPALMTIFPVPAAIASLNLRTIFELTPTEFAPLLGVDSLRTNVGATPSTLCDVERLTAECVRVAELPEPSFKVPELSSRELAVIPIPDDAKSPDPTV
jgi:hypothetical protein